MSFSVAQVHLLAVAALVIALIALLIAALALRKQPYLQHMAAVEAALTKAIAELRIKQDATEHRLAQLPSVQEFGDIRVKLASVEAKQEAVLTEAHGARAAIRRVEDFLLKSSRNHDSKF